MMLSVRRPSGLRVNEQGEEKHGGEVKEVQVRLRGKGVAGQVRFTGVGEGEVVRGEVKN